MKAVVIYAHPNPQSFNAAILRRVLDQFKGANVDVTVRDLYEMEFNPVFSGRELGSVFSGQGSFEDVLQEQQYIAAADLLVFVYPIWWFTSPAILKGFIDRVFTNGFAFSYTAEGFKPLMKGKKAMVIQTGGNTPEAYNAYNLTGVPQGIIERGTLQFTGFDAKTLTFLNIQSVTQKDREDMLKQVAAELASMLAENVIISHTHA